MSGLNVGARLESMAATCMRGVLPRAVVLCVDWRPSSALGWRLWSRSAALDAAAKPWPVGRAPAPGAVVRLNKAREATEFAVAAARSVMPEGGPIVLFGGNDEGIRSVKEVAGVRFDSVEAGGHGRVLLGHASAGTGRSLSDFRRVRELALPGAAPRPWVSYPGCFARGGLDRGTELLLGTLADVPAPARVLDFATGTGVIAAAASLRWPAARVTGCDADTVALCAAAENAPTARFVAGDGLTAVGPGDFELILSNPPFHEGKARADRIWREFLEAASGRLVPGGEIRVVVQREVKVGPALAASFDEVRELLISGGFVIWSARGKGAKK